MVEVFGKFSDPDNDNTFTYNYRGIVGDHQVEKYELVYDKADDQWLVYLGTYRYGIETFPLWEVVDPYNCSVIKDIWDMQDQAEIVWQEQQMAYRDATKMR